MLGWRGYKDEVGTLRVGYFLIFIGVTPKTNEFLDNYYTYLFMIIALKMLGLLFNRKHFNSIFLGTFHK